MEGESANDVAQALAEVEHYKAKIKTIEKEIEDLQDRSDFTGNELRYKILIDRLNKARLDKEEESVRVANNAVAEASADVKRYIAKIKEIEERSDFTGDEPLYKTLNECLEKASERLEKAREYHLRLTQSSHPAFQPRVEPLARGEPATKRPRWNPEIPIKRVNYAKNSNFVAISSEDLEGAGIGNVNLVLYCRKRFHEQFQFLTDRVIKNERFGWILGPPGTGKSCATYVFCISELNPEEWVVTWIHISRLRNPECIRIDGNERKMTRLINNSLLDLIESYSGPKKHFVVLGGYAASVDGRLQHVRNCNDWLQFGGGKPNRRLVVICSMSSRGKTNEQDDMIQNIEEFFVPSWMLQEYQQAVKSNDLWKNVKPYFDSHIITQKGATLSRLELVQSKYYFSGGSARYMFSKTTKEVIEFITDAVEASHDIVPYLMNTIGSTSQGIINRLFSNYRINGKRTSSIVSSFAVTLLAIKNGPALIQTIVKVLDAHLNPSMEGWMMEMWFFSKVKIDDIRVTSRSSAKKILWRKSLVLDFDPERFQDLTLSQPVWLKPLKWNQGGYDAVYVDKEKQMVRFVQITRGEEHSFKIQYFHALLSQMSRVKAGGFEILDLQICFLVSLDRLHEFKIPNGKISGRGLLKQFKWEKGKELDHVEICGVDWRSQEAQNKE